MGLLQHLKSYKRVSPPSDVENTYLLENSLLPNPLSNSRLPFHLLMQTKHYWKIICESATVVLLFSILVIYLFLHWLTIGICSHLSEEIPTLSHIILTTCEPDSSLSISSG